ncbi:VOC family protein [Cryptosporangium arvum]|jgi:predicted enzyme related to lactoylglutathione lyase|uniref:Lactoylglutathione lyase family protein n=1 Tax=Cryptosporangium arvum DSM 44712 TaxID=927661 RepID=A0A010YRW0_9ACTN|nr:VOC family protein [Cryptosporangium arvum]EXG82950.1 lactoylglutathione lyase family protein [Cryptosporangium arvum DSM 44712]
MNFVSIRVITADVARLVGFYEKTTGLTATWATPEFATFTTGAATLAIGGERTVPVASPAANRSVIVEFLVDDVDALHGTLDDVEVVMPPTTMPWGNRSLLVRDPDGNLVNFFKP